MDEPLDPALVRERLRLETLRLRTERSKLAAELRAQRLTARSPGSTAKSWREALANPLLLAIVGGSLTLLTAIVTNFLGTWATREADDRRAQHQRDSESRALQSELIKSFVSTGSATARDNLGFLIDSGLIPDHEERIKRYLADRSKPAPNLGTPGIPTNGGAQAPCPKLDVTRNEAGTPLRLAVAIGVGRLNPAGYQGWEGGLRGPVTDAGSMTKLAQGLGYRPVSVLDAQGRSECVLSLLNLAVSALRPGDSLLLSYSGHGARSGEGNRRVEQWVLFDRLVNATELLGVFQRGAAGSQIILVQDSDNVPAFLPVAGAAPLAPSLLVLAGAQDKQNAMDGEKQGAFTEALLAVWDEGRFQGSYEALLRAVAARMPKTQQPQLYVRGADPKAGQRPAFR